MYLFRFRVTLKLLLDKQFLLSDTGYMEMYPILEINRNITANRFYAFPIIGFLAKIIMLIPVFIWLFLVSIALFVVNMLINPFVVLFTGKYWQTSYSLSLGFMRLSTKITAYFFGLTDKYPYFKLSIPDFKLDMACPVSPSRFFAVPLLGGFVRILLIIPFSLFYTFISYAYYIGWFGSFAKVLFQGQYPESTYQLGRDNIRLALASSVFMLGLSDNYPSFEIDLKNKKGIKFMLLALGGLLYTGSSLGNTFNDINTTYNPKPATVQNYNFSQINVNNTSSDQELNQLIQQLQQSAE